MASRSATPSAPVGLYDGEEVGGGNFATFAAPPPQQPKPADAAADVQRQASKRTAPIHAFAPTALRRKASLPKAAAPPKPRLGEPTPEAVPEPRAAAPVAADAAVAKVDAAGAGTTSSEWFTHVTVPYDPAQPNVYDEWEAEQGISQRQEELEAALRVKSERARRAFASLIEPGASAPGCGASGSMPPPPPRPPQGAAPDEVGRAMLQKMGWTDGTGLGKEEQGMTTPLEARKTASGVVVIASASRFAP